MDDWYQQSLTPPDVIEVRARLGVIPETDHVQALVEVFDPITGVLVGQWSYPHSTTRQMGAVLTWIAETMRLAAENNVDPF